MVHALKMLADDVEARIRQQVMDVGDAAGDRILDRQHGQRGAAVAHRRDRVLERRRRQRLPSREHLAAGEIGIGAGLALKGDEARGFGRAVMEMCGFGEERAAINSRGAGEIGRSIDTERNRVNERHVDAHAGFERAQLLEALAPLQRRRRQRDEALERGAAIGVEPDMVVMRALAPGHRQTRLK